MHARISTVAFLGIDIVDVDVQVHLGGGVGAFLLVGLPDKTIAESRERVRAALAAIGLALPVKRITVNPGGRLSLQKHFHRSEHWVVVTGTAEVTVGDKVLILHENESTYIPLGEVHRLANPGKIPLEIIEIQVGAYTGEDDIVRIEDTYGRT